jgi:threonine aldolase
MIDLRSDTVTVPTLAMRKAMAEAEVGDDVYGEDPTVNQLQEAVAKITGFDEGLLMPSGTMANLSALATHADRGTEVILPEKAHAYENELGGMAAFAGLIPRPIKAPLGVPELEAAEQAIRRSTHHAPPGVILIENTHNAAGGTVVPISVQQKMTALAKREGLPIHLDGARAFNAATALNINIKEVCAGFDSASICLSKGLGAPIGTILLGKSEFISRAHRYRKILGGGMRQSGVVAAAGLIAINQSTELLTHDHKRARYLGERLARINGVDIDLATVQTNMVFVTVPQAQEASNKLRDEGIKVSVMANDCLRFVTHHQVTDEDILTTIEVAQKILGSKP